MVWPPQALRRRFTEIVEPMTDQMDDLGEASERLAVIRDKLLPKLVSGEIDVSGLDLDVLVGAVL